MLFGFRPEIAEKYPDGKIYNRYYAELKQHIVPLGDTNAFERHIRPRLLGLIAESLLTREAKARKLAEAATLTAELGSSDAVTGDGFVSRTEYLEQIHEIIGSGRLILCLWGEAGTGKTTLARQAAADLSRSPVLVLRASNTKALNSDIVEALIAFGMEPASWSESYCRVALKRALAESSQNGVVVLDDISDADDIWDLVPPTPRVPVIVTSREEVHSPHVSTIEIHDFSESQAIELARNELGDIAERTIHGFALALGYRPLALRHAVLFLKETAGVGVSTLTDELVRSIVAGLHLVVRPDQEATNLATLYTAILHSIVDKAELLRTLDVFLAIAGKSGLAARVLTREFASKSHEIALSTIAFESGLRTLNAYGLVRTDGHFLSMHALTYEVFRDLRGAALFDVERSFLQFILSDDIVEPVARDVSSGPRWAWALKKELLGTADLEVGWKYIYCVDERTWLRIIQDRADERLKIIRYEILPHAIYRVDYQAGERTAIQRDEALELKNVVIKMAEIEGLDWKR